MGIRNLYLNLSSLLNFRHHSFTACPFNIMCCACGNSAELNDWKATITGTVSEICWQYADQRISCVAKMDICKGSQSKILSAWLLTKKTPLDPLYNPD